MNIIEQHKVLLSRRDLTDLGIDKSNVTLLRAEATGRFPRRVRINGTRVAWLRDEVVRWLDDIAEQRKTHVYAAND